MPAARRAAHAARNGPGRGPEPRRRSDDPGPLRHDTDVRRRRGLWAASCTCGWSSETLTSAFTAWSATRRHLHEMGTVTTTLPGVPRRPGVRLLDEGEGT